MDLRKTMRTVKILRGLPGSGKSIYLKNNFPNAKVYSTDDYFYIDGIYKFDRELLPLYHNRTLACYLDGLFKNEELIVVDNTNIKIYEIAPFYRAAEALNYDVEIIFILCHPEVCLSRNIHEVPAEIINSMFHSLESIPTWWKQKVIFNS